MLGDEDGGEKAHHASLLDGGERGRLERHHGELVARREDDVVELARAARGGVREERRDVVFQGGGAGEVACVAG